MPVTRAVRPAMAADCNAGCGLNKVVVVEVPELHLRVAIEVCQQSGLDARQLAVLIEHLRSGWQHRSCAQSIEKISTNRNEKMTTMKFDADCAEIHV